MNKHIAKILSILLIAGLNWTGLSAVGNTLAYFNDIENAQENTLSAGILDFRLTKQNVNGFVGMENNGEIFHTSVAIPESGSMPMQYFAYSAPASPVCSEFRVRVKQNEAEIFYGSLPDFLSATTTVFGTWKFEFDLPVGASVTQGNLCQANITFSAWREEIENPEDSGFFDIETLSLNLKAKTIVLNEILAYPNPNHPYPANREFIELKNNGNASVDVAGWKVSEISGASEKKYTITTSGGSNSAVPYGGSTIIPAGGWLVLLLSDTTAFNNGGDTIRLYDSSNNKLDEYSYEAAKYGMSDARYLDGIGEWVDPIPTPGRMNVLEGENICATPSVAQEEQEESVVEAPKPEVAVEEPVINEPIIEEQALEEQITETKEAATTEDAVVDEVAPTLSDVPAGEVGVPTESVGAEEIFPAETLATIEEEPVVVENNNANDANGNANNANANTEAEQTPDVETNSNEINDYEESN